MKIKVTNCNRFAFSVVTLLMGTGLLTANTVNAQEAKSVATAVFYCTAHYISSRSHDTQIMDSSTSSFYSYPGTLT